MELTLSKEERDILWQVINAVQGSGMNRIITIEQHILKGPHIIDDCTANWLKESREEFNILQNIKEKL